jgi:hypothetical protein
MSTKDMARLFPARSYLRMFFQEKDIPSKMFSVKDSQGLHHSIPNEAVVEAIASTQGQERRKIEDTLRKLDFHNADINHFLEHLAKGLAEQYSGAMRFAGESMSFRTKAIKLAARLPKGSPERRALLEVLASGESNKTAGDPAIDREIKAFAKEYQDFLDDHIKSQFANLWQSAIDRGMDHYYEVGIDWGRKYARIWKTAGGTAPGRSVLVFVDRDTGDILKSASWKAPAKHPRGNVMDRAGRMRSVGPSGANYLR